jgi:hypothetical protein
MLTEHLRTPRSVASGSIGSVIGARRSWSCLAACCLLLAGCGRTPEELFSESVSPDGAWRLRLTVSQSKMPQGPFFVTAYAVDGTDKVSKLLESKLENDGVPFTVSNIAARWTGQSAALLCLRATDRPDRGWRIEVGPEVRAVPIEKC